MKKTLISVVLLSLVLLASQSVGAQTVGLRSDLFTSNSASLETVVVPGNGGSIFGVGTVNYKPNADLYVTLKGALGKEFKFLSEFGSSAVLDATYLMNDKFALNFHIDDIGNVNATAEYYILNNNSFDLAVQLGLGYGKSLNIGKFFVGTALLASYDVLPNLNISASVAIDYDFEKKLVNIIPTVESSKLYIADEIRVNYVPIKYADITLAYNRLDGIAVNDTDYSSSSDVLQLAVGTGINATYGSTLYSTYFADEFDIEANAMANEFLPDDLKVKGLNYILNPNSYYKSIALTNALALNYNVDFKLFGLLDGKDGLSRDMLDITAGLDWNITNALDLSFFVGAYLTNMINNTFNTDMLINLGAEYDINNSLSVGLNLSAYLLNLSSDSVSALMLINPGISYAVNSNMKVGFSYIGMTDFNGGFKSALTIGAECKF